MARAGRAYPNVAVLVRGADVLARKVEGRGEALPVLAARSQAAGRADGAGHAQPVTATKTIVIGQVLGGGAAAPAGAAHMRVLGRVTGMGTAVPVMRHTVREIGQAAGSGQALPVRADVIANLVTSVGQARPMGAAKALATHPAVGIGQARPVTHAQGGPLGRVTAAGVALPLRSVKTNTIGQAVGAGAARPVLRRTPPLRVGLPKRAWSARYLGRGTAVEPMSDLSLEFLRFWVDNALGSEQVEIAFTTPGVKPTEGQWNPASWGPTGKGGAEARIRVGPGGGVVLPDGTYQGWVRVTRPDERPVLQSGLVPII
ncbi:hypothetical protein AB0K18_42845 [Nonomuraea sp. NPDC049421]|uniref:hypothetical protein n=1 Tax=Nonomuraea sp. NPDC049421 TaxID=3155275 RepID=UPI00341D3169